MAAEPLVQVRYCTAAGCTTRLSRYNPDLACAEHGGWSDATLRKPGRHGFANRPVPAIKAMVAHVLITDKEGNPCCAEALAEAARTAKVQAIIDADRGHAVLKGPLPALLAAIETAHHLAVTTGQGAITDVQFIHGTDRLQPR